MTLRIGDLARHTGVYGIGTIVGGIGRAALIPIVARYVPTDEYGKASVVFIFITLLTIIAELGLSSSLIKFYNETSSEDERRRVVSTIIAASLMLALPIAVVSILLAADLSAALLGSADYRLLILIGIAGGLGNAILQVGLAFERALARSHRYVVFTLMKGGLALGLSIVLVAVFRQGALGLLIGAAVPPLLLGIVVYGRLIRRFAKGCSRATLKSVFHFGSPLVPMNLAMWVLAYSDIYLLRRLMPSVEALSEVGLYQYAHEICLVLVLPITSLNLAWPQFLFASHSRPGAPVIFSRIHIYFAFLLTEMALLLSLFSDKIIRYVGSLKYIESSEVIPYLAGSLVFYGCSILFSSGLYVAGKTRVLAVIVALCAGLNFALNLLLIPPMGKEGAAAATLVTNALMALVILRFSQREYRVPFHLNRTAAGVAVPAVLIAILITKFGSIGGSALPLRILAAIGVSAGLFAIFGMTPADLRKGWGTALSIFTTRPGRQ
jgi:O-antigen/teichoic acid export membrane protein